MQSIKFISTEINVWFLMLFPLLIHCNNLETRLCLCRTPVWAFDCSSMRLFASGCLVSDYCIWEQKFIADWYHYTKPLSKWLKILRNKNPDLNLVRTDSVPTSQGWLLVANLWYPNLLLWESTDEHFLSKFLSQSGIRLTVMPSKSHLISFLIRMSNICWNLDILFIQHFPNPLRKLQ